MRRIWGSLLLILGVLLSGIGCGAREATPIKIGVQGPMTGQWATEGEGFQRAVQVVADQINAAGGLLQGRPVEVLVMDDRGDPDEARRAAERLVEQGVVAVIGPYNSDAVATAMEVYAAHDVLHLTPSATAVHLTQKGAPLFFRLSFPDDRQGAFAAEFMVETLDVQRVALVHDGSAYAKGLAEAARDALEAQGGTVALFTQIAPGQRDFSDLLSGLESGRAELLYFSGYYPDAALLVRALRDEAAFKKVRFMGGDAVYSPEFISMAGGESAVGTLVTTMPLPEDVNTDEANTFKAAYVETYGVPPRTVWSLTAADACRLIALAIEETGSTDGEALADYLRTLENYRGVSGTFRGFDDQGERLGSSLAVYVVNRDWEFVPYQP
ncbi:MAG: branched-chain amino acid ABC transporter substrate-binding protein [Anaerolineae bacterium]